MLSKAFLTFVKIYKNKNLLETKLNVGSRFSKHGSKLNIMPICRYNLSSLTNICKNSEEQSKAKKLEADQTIGFINDKLAFF